MNNCSTDEIKAKVKSEFSFIDEKKLDDLWVRYLDSKRNCGDEKAIDISNGLKKLSYSFLAKEFNNGKYLDYATGLINTSTSFSQDLLDKLNDLSLSTQYNPTFEEIKSLLNVDKLNVLVREIVSKNYSKIKKFDYSFLSSNELLQSFVEVYCELNNVINYDEIDNIVETDASSRSSLSMFINDASRYKLLTREEEIFLFTELKKGNKEAKERIINSNLRLVVYVANRCRKENNYGLELIDLVQEGSIGLMTAIDKYDLSKGKKFSTYAVWWIRQSITRAIENQSSTIRIPAHIRLTINKLLRYKEKVLSEKQREATDEEIMRDLNLSPVRLKQIKKVLEGNIISINQKVGDEDAEISDFIPDNSNLSLEDGVVQKMEYEYLYKLFDIAKLSDRNKEILKYRYGMYGKLYTLEEIGEVFGITRERVRQIEVESLKRLKYAYDNGKAVESASSDEVVIKKKKIKKSS